MSADPYKRVAGIYDRLFEPMNRGLRLLGLRMFMPPRGAGILDVGCGTGLHLEMYQRLGCTLCGLDVSHSMLALASARLGRGADLRFGDATTMPYEARFFDLVICMLALHEMNEGARRSTVAEIKRVVRPNGRILFIDFHSGTPRPFKGWVSKLVILASELAAGSRHFRNYRQFMASGGLPHLIKETGLLVEKEKIVGDDTMALFLIRSS